MIVYKPDLEEMVAKYKLDPEPFKLKQLDLIGREIRENKARYVNAVQNSPTGIVMPWGIWASLHFREASLNFSKNMVNGQPLNQRTTLVPTGKGPWNSWEEASRFALGYKANYFEDCHTEAQWFYACERYNGLGYRMRGLNSPYVWAFTDQSDEHGVYKERTFFGKATSWFDSSAVNTRPGVAAIMRQLDLMNLDPWT